MLQDIIDKNYLDGKVGIKNHRTQYSTEVTLDSYEYGVAISKKDGKAYPTNRFKIHYSATGTHIVPMVPEGVE